MEAYKRISLGLAFLLFSCQSNSLPENNNSKVVKPTPEVGQDLEENNTFLERDNLSPKSSLPRTIKIEMRLYDTKDLKVQTGDLVKAGQVIGDRSLERDKLLYQKSQLQTQLSRLSVDNLYIPILPIANLPPANYQVEEANLALAEHNLNAAKLAVNEQKNKISKLESMRSKKDKLRSVGLGTRSEVELRSVQLSKRLGVTNSELVQNNKNKNKSKNSKLPLLRDRSPYQNTRSEITNYESVQNNKNLELNNNFKPLTSDLVSKANLTPNFTNQANLNPDLAYRDMDAIVAHEFAIAQKLQTEVEKAAIQINLARANLALAKQNREYQEYLHQLEIYKRSVNLSRQKLELAKQEEKVNYQRSQISSQINQIDNQISQLTEVRSPYDGTIKKIKWAGQSDNVINVIVTLAVESNSSK